MCSPADSKYQFLFSVTGPWRQPRERITGSAEPMCLRWMTEQWVGEFRTSTSTFRPAMFRLRTNYGVSEVHGGDL